MGAALPRGAGEDRLDFFARQLAELDLPGGKLCEHGLLLRRGGCFHAIIKRLAEFMRERPINFAGIATLPRRDFRGKQTGDESIFVRCPNAAIQAGEGGSCALLSAKTERAIEQTVDEPLEADRHLVEASGPASP
jgi:hypothetical protein